MTTHVLAAVDDMLFVAKIRGAAQLANAEVAFARNVGAAIEAAKKSNPALVVIDLHSQCIDAFELAGKFKRDESTRDIPLLGFYSHVHTELQRKARDAGFDRVMPRSVFSKHLTEILQLKF
ncbi:MAG: hypothetical protein WKF74_11555 [Pyrinomonadaceae bacterium]